VFNPARKPRGKGCASSPFPDGFSGHRHPAGRADELEIIQDRFSDRRDNHLRKGQQGTQLPNLHPHVCRHTFSVRYLMNGGDVFSLQKILGHSSLEMTRKYVNLASGYVKEMHRRFSPMDNLD
jgi:integrase